VDARDDADIALYVKLPVDLHTRIKTAASKRRQTLKDFVLMALDHVATCEEQANEAIR
jgi:hypothetical protein